MRGRARLVLLALGAVTALACAAAAPAGATFPGPNGRIAFADFYSGQLFAVNPDGSGLVQLTHTGRDFIADNPSWSADGKHILFSRYRADRPFGQNRARIWIMNADGSHKRQVADDADGFRDYTPKFTPDAGHIVFSRCKPNDGVCAIWKMRADGAKKKALSPYVEPPGDEAIDFAPSVSPDGKWVAYGHFAGGGFAARIFVVGIDGEDRHPVGPARLEPFGPDWSPDGERITFSSSGARPGSSIFTMRADGSDVERVTPSHYPFNDFDSVYSPRGDRFAYVGDRNFPDLCCVELFTNDTDGDDERLFDLGLDPPGVLWPSWGTAPLVAHGAGDRVPAPSSRVPPGSTPTRAPFLPAGG